MKKLILVLAILVAVPVVAYGALDVSMRLDANDVNIVYTGADPNNLPRAFALDITLVGTDPNYDPNIVIKDVNDFDPCGVSDYRTRRGYGIYPARIVIDSCGVVTSWGSPVADPCDPGGSLGLPSKHIILELGSLYVGAPNAPDVNGILCELHFDCNGSKGDVNIVMKTEDTYRGGIVLEDGCTVPITTKTLRYTPCVVAQPTKCLRDNIPDHNQYSAWVAWGEPNCWCYKRQCRGDTDGKKAGLYWVATADWNLLRASLSKNDACLATISWSGVPGICADLDHKKAGLYRVATADWNALRAFLSKTEVNVPCCDMALPDPCNCVLSPDDKWNFWSN